MANTRHARTSDSRPAHLSGHAKGRPHAVFRSPYATGIAGFILLLSAVAALVHVTRLQMVAAAEDDISTRATILVEVSKWTQAQCVVYGAP